MVGFYRLLSLLTVFETCFCYCKITSYCTRFHLPIIQNKHTLSLPQHLRADRRVIDVVTLVRAIGQTAVSYTHTHIRTLLECHRHQQSCHHNKSVLRHNNPRLICSDFTPKPITNAISLSLRTKLALVIVPKHQQTH